MPAKSPAPPVRYPRLGFAVCATPEQVGLSPEDMTRLKSLLDSNGFGDLLNYAPPLSWMDAVTLLGAEWDQGDTFGDNYLFVDRSKVKVRCANNLRNRPVTMSAVELRVSDILNGRWELNGETGILGRDAAVLDFQHTLIALILASQDWADTVDAQTGEKRWAARWPLEKYPDGPTISKCLVYGIENSDRVVNTINTGRPRSLSDVLYRCPYFSDLPNNDRRTFTDRKNAVKTTAAAIRTVWNRTGMYFSLHGFMTHSEACAWLENHGGHRSKLLEAVRHVLECNKDGSITRYVSLGYAAALLYLMGSHQTDEEKVSKYFASEARKDRGFDWDGWERAKLFWSEFGKLDGDEQPAGKLEELTMVLDKENDIESSPEFVGTRSREKDYAIVMAWRTFRKNGKTVPADACKVRRARADRYGNKPLDWTAEEKSVGGVDLGNDRIVPDPDDGIAPTPDVETEVENGKKDEAQKVDKKYHLTEPLKTPITSAAALSVMELLGQVYQDHPDFGCVLVKTPKGDYAAWGDGEIVKVTPYVTKTARMHPRGIRNIVFRPDEVDVLTDHLTTAGLVVALVTETVAPKNGDPRYTVETVFRPGREKS